MLYVIKNNSVVLLENFLSELKNKLDLSENDYYYLDFQDTDINSVTSIYLSGNILGDRKLILVKNFNLVNEKLAKKYDSIFSKIIESNTSNILVLQNENIDKKNILFNKSNLNKFSFIDMTSPVKENLQAFVISYLKKKNVEYNKQLIPEFIKKNNNNFDKIVNEIYKLEIGGTSLTSKEVDKIYTSKIEFSIVWKLIDSVFNKNIDQIEMYINKLKSMGFSVFALNKILINEIALIFLIKRVNEIYKSNFFEQISKYGINHYRATKLKQKAISLSYDELKNLSDNIFKFEINTKKYNFENTYMIYKCFLTTL